MQVKNSKVAKLEGKKNTLMLINKINIVIYSFFK